MNKQLSFKLNRDKKLIQLTTDYYTNKFIVCKSLLFKDDEFDNIRYEIENLINPYLYE